MDFSSAVLALTVLIYSAILHEIAHGYVAEKLGDPTARLMGRLTLNPQKHIDLWMSVLLPLLLLISHSPVIFGAAKPVPIDPFNLREGRKDVAIVALAGPLTNVIIAIAAPLLLRLTAVNYTAFFVFVSSLLVLVVKLNLLLAIFNLLPIPPLDGSKIFSLILPEKDANTYLSFGSIGFFIIFVLLLFPIGGFSLGQFVFNLLNYAQSLLLP